VAGDRIQYIPKSLAPQEFVSKLREHKEEVLEYLFSQTDTMTEVETASLLAWASELAEQDLVLREPVSFVEEPLRPITIPEVSQYARRQVWFIAYAHLQQRPGGMGRFLPPWWKEREQAALGALAALREALEKQESAEIDGNV
jgi:hypothetical protein